MCFDGFLNLDVVQGGFVYVVYSIVNGQFYVVGEVQGVGDGIDFGNDEVFLILVKFIGQGEQVVVFFQFVQDVFDCVVFEFLFEFDVSFRCFFG